MEPWTYNPPSAELDLVYEDRDVVVIDKPSGLLSVPGRGTHLHDSALSRLRDRWPLARDVHRLDLDTSGLLIFALRRKAERALKKAFRERRVGKVYVARVDGEMRRKSGKIDLPLRRLHDQPRSVVDPVAGRAALTRYRVAERSSGSTLVILHPQTGRSHQLRVHLASIGHPILGDRFYGDANIRESASRLLLHAAEVTFPHPYHDTPVTLTAAVPFR